MTRFDGAQSRLSPSSSGKKQRAVAAGTSGAAVRPCALQTGELLVFSALLGVVALVFLPSLHSQFTLPKLAVLYPVLGLAALCWFARFRRGDTIAIRASIAVPILALLAWWTVTLPFAVDIPTAVWGAAGRGNGFALHVAVLLLFAGTAAMRIGVGGVRRLLAVMLGILTIVGAYAIAQAAGFDVFTWPNVRPGSTVGHPVPLAAMLALGLPVGLAMASSSRTPGSLTMLGGATTLILFALGTTLSRGPWIGAACGSAVTVALLLRVTGGRRLRTAAIAAVGLVAVVATVWLARVPGTRVTQRIALIARATTDPSFMNRFEYFSAALTMIRERPVIGSGFETFGLRFPPLRPVESETVDEDTIPTMVHNGYLDRTVWNGIPGLMLYLALMAAISWALLRIIRNSPGNDVERRALACGVFGGLIAFWIQDLSGWHEVSSSVFFWFAAGVGVCLSVDDDGVPGRPGIWQSQHSHATTLIVTPLVILLAVCSWTVWRETYADARLAQAQRAGVGDGWRQARALVEDTRPVIGRNVAYLDRIGVIYLNRLRTTADRDAYRSAREVLTDAGAITRFDPYVLVHIVDAETLALLSGITRIVSNDAVDASLRAAELDPNNATVHETVARFHLASGHLAAALTEVHAARGLRPRRAGLSLLEGDIVRASGDKRAALDLYRAEVERHHDTDSIWLTAQQKVTAALIEAGDYHSALREAQYLASKAPADPVGKRLLEAARAYSR